MAEALVMYKSLVGNASGNVLQETPLGITGAGKGAHSGETEVKSTKTNKEAKDSHFEAKKGHSEEPEFSLQSHKKLE